MLVEVSIGAGEALVLWFSDFDGGPGGDIFRTRSFRQENLLSLCVRSSGSLKQKSSRRFSCYNPIHWRLGLNLCLKILLKLYLVDGFRPVVRW